MKPACLPTVADYLAVRPELWAWLARLPSSVRRRGRVLDVEMHPEPGEFVIRQLEVVPQAPRDSRA